MTFPVTIWALLAAAVIVSSIGFKNYVWFISLGYGFSIAAEGLLMLILFRDSLSLGTVLCCVLFVLYGCRLGGYLAFREFWLSCACLYVTQVTPVFYRLANGTGIGTASYIGAVIMLCGVVLESAADLQKNAAKKKNSHRFVDTGLYRLVRYPNHLGEWCSGRAY